MGSPRINNTFPVGANTEGNSGVVSAEKKLRNMVSSYANLDPNFEALPSRSDSKKLIKLIVKDKYEEKNMPSSAISYFYPHSASISSSNLSSELDLNKDGEVDKPFSLTSTLPPSILTSSFEVSSELDARLDVNEALRQRNFWIKTLRELELGKPARGSEWTEGESEWTEGIKDTNELQKKIENWSQIFSGAYDKWTKLIKSGWKNWDNWKQQEILHWAISHQDDKLAESLLRLGGDVNSPDRAGILLVHVIASEGGLPLLQHVWRMGAELNRPNASGKMAWQIALMRGNQKVIPFLLKNSKDSAGNPPPHIAAIDGDMILLHHLMKMKADFNMLNQNKQTVAQVAKGNHGVMHFLAGCYLRNDYIPMHNVDKDLLVGYMGSHDNRWVVINNSIISKDVYMLDSLFNYWSINPNAKNNYGNRPIHLAAKVGGIEVLKFFVERGANLNALNSFKKTALQVADDSGNTEIRDYIKTLYLNGQFIPQHAPDKLLLAKYMSSNETKQTLCRAIDRDDIQMVNALLKLRIDVNFQADKDKNTPAHLAAKTGNQEILKILLDAGANPNVKNAKDELVLKIALNSKNSESINLLKDFYSRRPRLLAEAQYMAAVQWDSEMIECIIGR
ncbi:ankyrin repeat domain-containing protein [Mycoavidus sp. B2-EB]|uniref:ankyrin repeat domain-containing protein n=1 Tax=Mycoavidus sp. B2-EB TaxID=2651972 RepID=UPI001624FD78|nr:ankyrin repeat domain-containing protein [Mycoavidus sp. B2-EB]BBO60432.1 phosphocholine transferase AnkX [Mycoavidus sp. B2-EB]